MAQVSSLEHLDLSEWTVYGSLQRPGPAGDVDDVGRLDPRDIFSAYAGFLPTHFQDFFYNILFGFQMIFNFFPPKPF